MEYVSFNQSWIGKYFFLKILRETQRYVSITLTATWYSSSERVINFQTRKKKERERKSRKERRRYWRSFSISPSSSYLPGKEMEGKIFGEYIYIYIYFQRVDPDPMAIPRTFSFNKDAARDFALPSPPLARSPQIYIYRERESLECSRRIPHIFEAPSLLPSSPKRYSRIPRFNRP